MRFYMEYIFAFFLMMDEDKKIANSTELAIFYRLLFI